MRSKKTSQPALRIVLLVLVGGCALASFGCTQIAMTPGTDPTPGTTPTSGLVAADVSIVDDPVGGQDVTALSCTFEVTQVGTDGTDPVTLRVDWSASCGTHKSETFSFKGAHEVFTSTYEDPTGAPIGMTFWATIHWTDSRGTHVVRSTSAACTY